ncbi:Desumoylating isopeptidase 1 [Bulinus truncatus]|nr:Desumoylating isopeptidase 1 [Bulinus truncatus]
MDSQTSDVKVYIYDISMGMARAMSQGILGRQINGIWHTGIVAYGQEYFFGSGGIEQCSPGGTCLGQPLEIVDLGKSEIPFDVFMDYLHELSNTSYKGETYHLFHHNCNNFSSEVAQFLTGKDIPSHITSLPQEVLNTPFGAMIQPFVDALHVQGGHSLF